MASDVDERLKGLVALVTGAGSGIGRATAAALARAGAAVVLVGRRRHLLDETAGIIGLGDITLVLAMDVTNQSDVGQFMAKALRRLGKIDILVNAAGLNLPVRTIDGITAEDLQVMMAVNFHAPFLLTRAVLPQMRERASGTIINIASIAGLYPGRPSGAAYGASKSALVSFTMAINQSERKHGIRACVICPGEVDTPFLDARANPPGDAERALMLQPEDVASTVLHIATLPHRATIELVTIRPTALE